MCRPSEPDVFGKPVDLHAIELFLDPLRAIEDLRERRARLRIEIDRDLIRRIQIVHRRKPRVHRDRRELRHVEQRLQRSADQPRRHVVVRQRLDAHARRHRLRRAMLIEGRPVDAVRQPLHHERPVVDDRKNERRDLRVEANQVALGLLDLRPEDLVEVGDLERVAVGQLESCRSCAPSRGSRAARRSRRCLSRVGTRSR